ncbi:MAG: sulfatase-like hydrolase/transferase [Pirellulaceae bacterium]
MASSANTRSTTTHGKRSPRSSNSRPNLTTLAQELQSHGYRTAGFCGNAGVSRGFGYDTGFEVYDHESAKFGTFDYSLPRAVNWLEQRDDDKPFFLFVHGYDVHGQAMPSDGFDGRFVSEHYDRRFAGTSQEQEYLREEGLDRGQLDLRRRTSILAGDLRREDRASRREARVLFSRPRSTWFNR